MEEITPTLLILYKLAEQFTTKPAYHRLTIACLSLSEACSFFLPELRQTVWKRAWDCLMMVSQEKVVQVEVAEAAMKSLTLMCPLMLEALSACGVHVKELMKNPAMSAAVLENASNYLSRLGKRRKERNAISKYGREGCISLIFVLLLFYYYSIIISYLEIFISSDCLPSSPSSDRSYGESKYIA